MIITAIMIIVTDYSSFIYSTVSDTSALLHAKTALKNCTLLIIFNRFFSFKMIIFKGLIIGAASCS